MQKKTSNSVTKKPAKKAAKKPLQKVSKKTSKKPLAKGSKKTTPRSLKSATDEPAEKTSTRAAEKPSKPDSFQKDKRPILVPLDFSTHSETALEYAADLAGRLQRPLAVLHVVHDPGDAPGYYHVKGRRKQLRRLEDVAREMLDEFMAKMVKRHSKDMAVKNAERLLVTGLPVSRILEVAEKLQPRMVIMGSAGRTGLSHFLLGSKAEQLLRMCPFPVTIVKVPEKKK